MNKRLGNLGLITNTFCRRYNVKISLNLNFTFTDICCGAPILLPGSGLVRMRRNGVNTLVFKTNAEKNMYVYNVNSSDEAAIVIHIINYNSHVSLINIRNCFTPLCAIK